MCGISGIINFQSSSKDDELSIKNEQKTTQRGLTQIVFGLQKKMTFLGIQGYQ